MPRSMKLWQMLRRSSRMPVAYAPKWLSNPHRYQSILCLLLIFMLLEASARELSAKKMSFPIPRLLSTGPANSGDIQETFDARKLLQVQAVQSITRGGHGKGGSNAVQATQSIEEEAVHMPYPIYQKPQPAPPPVFIPVPSPSDTVVISNPVPFPVPAPAPAPFVMPPAALPPAALPPALQPPASAPLGQPLPNGNGSVNYDKDYRPVTVFVLPAQQQPYDFQQGLQTQKLPNAKPFNVLG